MVKKVYGSITVKTENLSSKSQILYETDVGSQLDSLISIFVQILKENNDNCLIDKVISKLRSGNE